MERVVIASLYKATPADGSKVTVCGWAKTVRDSKKIGFISLADGSCYKPVQIVFQADKLESRLRSTPIPLRCWAPAAAITRCRKTRWAWITCAP